MAWAGGSTLIGAAPAWSQGDYPKAGTTLRYIVPFPPGGLTDVMARLVGQQLGARWGLSVVIDNKPGNGGQIGADVAAKAPGDGYNLLAITLTLVAQDRLWQLEMWRRIGEGKLSEILGPTVVRRVAVLAQSRPPFRGHGQPQHFAAGLRS